MNEAKPMMCPQCGIPMNRHAERLIEPRDAAEAKAMNPALGGVILELHRCPGCGDGGTRAGTRE